MQTIEPLVHTVAPFLHGLAGWQAWPAVHDTQLPALHTRFVPQAVPFGWLLPLSVHTAVPVEQLSVPVWHGFAVGVQAPPALQVTQLPVMQTMFVPQPVPFGRFPDSWQTDEPVAHDVVPVLQAFAGWQLVPAAHMTHVPALQTRSVPQVTPFANDWPVSVQSIVGEQTLMPA